MLKHPTALRQGVMPTPARLGDPALPANPGEAYVDPGVLVLSQAHPAGDGRLEVNPNGVEDLCRTSPYRYCRCNNRRPRPRAYVGGGFPHRAALPRHPVGQPVVVVGVLQPDVLKAWPHHVPAAGAPGKYLELVTELEPAVR